MMRFPLVLLAVLLSYFSFAQNSDKLISDLNNAKDVESRVKAYQAIIKHYKFYKPDSAELLFDIAKKEFEKNNSKLGIASMAVIAGYLDIDRGHMESARQHFNKALTIFKQTKYRRGVISAFNGIGTLDGKLGNYTESLNSFLTALKIAEELGDKDMIASCYHKMGTLYEVSNNLEQSLLYFNKALSTVELGGVTSIKSAWLYNNIGVVYGKLGQLDKAKSYFMQSLDGAIAPDDLDFKILSLNNLGIFFDKTNQDDSALYYFDKAIAITREKNIPEHFARLVVSKSSVISKTNPKAAIDSLNAALITIQSIKLRSLELDLYDALAEAYYRNSDYKMSFDVLMRLRILEDSIESVEKSKELLQLQNSFDEERIDAKMRQAAAEAEKIKAIRNIIVVVAFVLATILLLVVIQYFKLRKLNKKMKEQEAQLVESNETKDRLFSIIGHDLRGPIGNVPVMLELMTAPDTTDKDRAYLYENLLSHSLATKETLDKLLYWGQSQIKGAISNPEKFTIASSLNGIIDLALSQARQKQITIVNKIEPSFLLYGDPSHFDFILRNLLSNAIKFTNAGGEVVLTSDKTTKDGFVVFAVRDNGVGIDAERLNVIFNPLSGSTLGTSGEKGTSIGLMLCNKFVNENGGDIWVESKLGVGTIFFFTFRLA